MGPNTDQCVVRMKYSEMCMKVVCVAKNGCG